MSQTMTQPPPPASRAAAAPSTAKAVTPPSAPPRGRPASLPANAVLVKSAPAVSAAPGLSRPASGAPERTPPPQPEPSQQRPRSKAATGPTPPPAPPSVPVSSWYANALLEPTGGPMSSFHRGHRGKIIFSPRPVPVEESDLLALPGQGPEAMKVCEVGKDLLYGMAYLYAAPLAVEHQWRGRVAHLQRVRQQQVPVPEVVRRGLEKRASYQLPAAATATAVSSSSSFSPAARSPPLSPSAGGGAAATAAVSSDYQSVMRFVRGEAAVLDRPGADLLLGVKVFIGDVLVEDHYPSVHALPQCTTTITAAEATQHWICVPLVLIGVLHQTLLSPITLFHTLSLSVVEHLLRVKLPSRSGSAVPAEESAAATPPPPLELPLRVEVVYGCRGEAFYCTDFIARGRCVLRMTENSKPRLKRYEEKLRALVKARRAAPQLIPRPASSHPPPRTCSGCGHPLLFMCTHCGADVCGQPTCVARGVVGYPRACTRHALPNKPTQ